MRRTADGMPEVRRPLFAHALVSRSFLRGVWRARQRRTLCEQCMLGIVFYTGSSVPCILVPSLYVLQDSRVLDATALRSELIYKLRKRLERDYIAK